ncbi:PEP-CTERM sorting domain-containing protein [Janthinobacterium fluminis]|uniref:PEP-CTERM sorting domain-containing protein n=1 Tax=Janthinobacterium fluminis TaxID=2987524 RepID=A0ABT5K8U9_9BURK|nr:PEP-CTERM sorting domain-containing protein [Janthinobacterium fluminis]MDC8760212.1 PEP-CTERM sorting domain-containing protein [Janthinobacterium fluminis]
MKKILLAGLFCAATAPSFAATTFTEDFSNLNAWTTPTYAHVMADPFGGSGNVLGFSNGTGGGDIFSTATFKSGYINFDYRGASSLGVNGGGFVGISQGLPGVHTWLAGGGAYPTPTTLVNDGTWHHYSVAFDASLVNAASVHLTLEQYNISAPDLALFRAMSVSDTPLPAVPEPENYAMLLAGLGILGFSLRRKTKAKAEA